MKTRNFLWGAMGLLAMASCSNDELVSVNHDGDEIAFNVVTNASTRVNADGVYCNNNLPQTFHVWATYDGKTYIEDDEIGRGGGSTDAQLRGQNGGRLGDFGGGVNATYWVNKSGTRYWPEGEVKFFAHANAGDKFSWNNGAPTIESFEVVQSVDEQKDLIYAVKTASKSDGIVRLNFRHALSQVVFKANNNNENLHVRVSGVSICKLGNINTFTYPTSSSTTSGDTDGNIEDHTGTTEVTATDESSWGKWNELTGGNATYSVTFDPKDVSGKETVSLTYDNEEGKEFNNKAMLLLPQKTTAWNPDPDLAEPMVAGVNGGNPEVDNNLVKPAEQNGTYFLVKCQIWNVAGSEFDEETDVCLWGKDGAKDIAIPAGFDWKQGKKYIYTFVFDGGGYDPDGPTMVLDPISFKVTVDDFEPADEKNVDLPQGVLQYLG